MGVFEVPWVVDGSKHSARLFRRTLQKQVGPGSGVDRLDDLKVVPLGQPGPGFRVMPGGGVAQSRDTDASARESYGPILTRAVDVEGVPGTGSSETRRDLVILEITDPEMESKTYPAPTAGEGWQDGDNFVRVTVIPNVDSLVPVSQRPVTRLEQITSGEWAHVTGITLAAIEWPKSTATISGTMIVDLRRVQRPEVVRRMVLAFPDGKLTSGRRIPHGAYGEWPLVGAERPMVDVPDFATRLKVTAYLEGVLYAKGNSTSQFVAGTRVGIGGVFSENGLVTREPVDAAQRGGFAVIGEVAVPAELRGTRQPIVLQGAVSSAASTGGLFVDYQSCVSVDYEFSGEL